MPPNILSKASDADASVTLAGGSADLRPLTGAQQNIWFHQQIDLQSAAYHLSYYCSLNGELDAARLAAAVNYAIATIEPLRAQFVVKEGKPYQRTQSHIATRLQVVDLSHSVDPDRLAHDEMRELQAKQLHLENGEVCRFALFKLAPRRWIWQWVVHHICLDGVGAEVLIQTVSKAYRDNLTSKDGAFRASSPDAISWSQAIEEDYAYSQSDQWAKDRAYWDRKLQDLDSPASMSDQEIDELYIGQPHRVFAELPRAEFMALLECGRAVCGSAYTLFSSAALIYLAKLCGKEDLTISVPTSGRQKNSRGVPGTLANQVPLRVKVAFDQTVTDLMISAANELKEGLAHNRMPFREIHLMRRQQGLPIASSVNINLVSFNYLADFGSVKGSFRMIGTAAVADVSLNIWDQRDDGPVQFAFEYNPERYSSLQASDHLDNLLSLFCTLPLNLQTKVGQLALLSPIKRDELIRASRGLVDPQVSCSLSELFEMGANTHASQVAVIHASDEISYGELHSKSALVSDRLNELGVGPGDTVAMMLEPSIPMIAVMLGIIKSGAAYLPIDLSYPKDRIDYILKDSAASVVLSHAGAIERLDLMSMAGFEDSGGIDLGSLLIQVVRTRPNGEPGLSHESKLKSADRQDTYAQHVEQLAYVIYTSGSTGMPKGVAVVNRGVVNMVLGQILSFDIKPGDRVFQFASLAFDASVSEVFTALCAGATLVLPPTVDRNELSSRLPEVCREFAITHITVPPVLLSIFDSNSFPTVETLIVAGEACAPAVVSKFAGQHRMLNAYGPTEASVCASISDPLDALMDGPQAKAPVPIGHPMWNTQLYILDACLEPMPEGVVGELYIAGDGLARGYLGRPGLTAERFIANPFGFGSSRMYRTGDVARRRGDGAIEYLGRADDQVKLRGFRIELGEIETALRTQFHELSQVAVIVRKVHEEMRLVAYVVGHAQGELPEVSQMRQQLARVLPEYMVPGHFVELKQLPLTANGKLDRKALPEPVGQVSETSYRAARSSSERLLCEIFSELTGVSQVGIDDNFFAIGGHSLLAMRLVARVRQRSAGALALRTLFECPTPAQLAPFVDAIQKDMEPDLLPGLGHLNDERVVLSYGQRRLWTLDRLEGASATYNMPMAMRIRGALDANALEQALSLLIERHEPLRTVMIEGEDGVPYGLLLPIPELSKVLVREEFDQSESLRARIERESALPFNLGQDLSIRATLINCGIDDAVLMLTIHHQAGDGISLGVLMDELSQAYSALVQGNEPGWKELAVQYSDWAAWQQSVLTKTLAQKVERAKERLSGMPESLSLPLDYPRQADRTRKAGYVSIELPVEVTRRLELIAREKKTTLFTVVLASYGALLARLSGQSEIVIGSPVSGRNRVECERLVGFMVNTLALPLTMDRTSSLIDLVDVARTSVEQALIDQDLPFEKLVEELNVPRSLAHTPVFQTMLAFQTEQSSHANLLGLSCSPEHVELPSAKFDLMLFLHVANGKLTGAMEYDADLFSQERVEVWARAYEFLTKELIENPDLPLMSRPLLDQQAVVSSTANYVSADKCLGDLTLHSLFEEQVAGVPDNLALVFEDQRLTYSELDKRANQLGRKLLQMGVTPGSLVAVSLPRSIDMIVSVLAILKTGAGYVPLDPEYPINRLHYMIGDSAAVVMISTTSVIARLDKAAEEIDSIMQWPELLCLDRQNVVTDIASLDDGVIDDSERLGLESPDNLAYVIYTSGSTGIPKGIEMRSGALVNLLVWQKQSAAAPRNYGAVLQFTSISFDVSFQEIFAALSVGDALVLLPAEDRLNAQAVLNTIERHGVTELYAPQSVIQFLVSEALRARPSSLKHIYQAGEALKLTDEIKEFLSLNPSVTLHNHYGPAETHVVTSWFASRDALAQELEPSIGNPIDGGEIYILDSALATVPKGVIGELYIAGECLARGYLNKPGMTAERFVANPFGKSGQRMYRSGDLASWNFDGSIAYHGRADQQVKIRGFRIELGEIEATLAREFAFQQVVVVPWGQSSDLKLVAYVVTELNASLPMAGVIRTALSKKLPDYMVPSAYVQIDRIPVTQNGKLNRSALPEPKFEGAFDLYRAPGSENEKLICKLFEELTQSTRVGLDDSFFDLGGHSLLAMRLITRIRVDTGLEISLRTLFENPIAEHLAQQLAQAKKSSKPKLVRGMGKKV